MSRDDFDIPDLGPAEPDRVTPSPSSTGATTASDVQPPPVKRSGGWFQSFLLILLVAACSGLGYWGLTMYEQLQAERESVAELQAQMKEMRGLLNLAETSAQKSGDTLLDQVTSMSKAAQDKYKHFDSEIAKLWAIAYQKNKPELEKQAKQITGQSGQLKSLDKQLKSQDTQLKAQAGKFSEQAKAIAAQTKALNAVKESLAVQQKKITVMSAEVNKSKSSVKDLVSADLKKVRSEVVAAQTAMRLSEEAMTDEQAMLTASLRKLTDRTAALENGQRKNGLERRVKNNEDAVRAYDATRRELNRNLLQIKKKINELQLAVEKQVK